VQDRFLELELELISCTLTTVYLTMTGNHDRYFF
jgi:hypothetical protein